MRTQTFCSNRGCALWQYQIQTSTAHAMLWLPFTTQRIQQCCPLKPNRAGFTMAPGLASLWHFGITHVLVHLCTETIFYNFSLDFFIVAFNINVTDHRIYIHICILEMSLTNAVEENFRYLILSIISFKISNAINTHSELFEAYYESKNID